MANTLRGRVFQVRPAQTIATKAGSTFVKRELILDCTRYDPYTGERGFDNFPCVVFAQDRAQMLDGFQPGEVVEVSFDLTGRKAEGSDAYYNDVRGYRIERLRQPSQPAPQAAPQPAQQPAAAPMPQPAPQQAAPQSGGESNDLPF